LIGDDLYGFHGPGLPEERPKLLLADFKGKISDVQLARHRGSSSPSGPEKKLKGSRSL
jgi:hypothetical protein